MVEVSPWEVLLPPRNAQRRGEAAALLSQA